MKKPKNENMEWNTLESSFLIDFAKIMKNVFAFTIRLKQLQITLLLISYISFILFSLARKWQFTNNRKKPSVKFKQLG